MSNPDDLIAQFLEISGGEENVARFYLSSHNWSLEDAISSFLGNQAEDENVASGNTFEEVPVAQQSSSALTTGGNSSSSKFEKKSEKPKFATLNDMTKRKPNEEEGQAFYAGGSERSGQQVLGPPKNKNFREMLSDMFRMAQEQNTTEVAETHAPSTSSGASWGQGVRLGMTDSDHTVVKPQGSDSTTGEKKPVVILKLWSQGFSIDDGELRPYDDPENKAFLETVMRGEIPHELLEMGWMVNVDVEDHSHEEYKKVLQTPAFKGSGHTLGSPAPAIEGTSSRNIASSNTKGNDSENERDAGNKIQVNTSQPTTTLQIRLADGSRLTAQFNLTHTLDDIYQYIQNARPQYSAGNFLLVSSFPTRELTDKSVTIEEAGLKNAAIMQRLK